MTGRPRTPGASHGGHGGHGDGGDGDSPGQGGGSSPRRPRRQRRAEPAESVTGGQEITGRAATQGRRGRGGAGNSGGGGQPPRQRVTEPNPDLEPVVIELRFEPGMSRFEFRRKVEALRRLGEDGRLFRATNPVGRDREVTRQYRQDLRDRIEAQYGGRNREFASQLITRIFKKMQPDHLQDLQLGGLDHASNLRMLHTFTNWRLGTQVWSTIQRLNPPDGTPIRIRIIE